MHSCVPRITRYRRRRIHQDCYKLLSGFCATVAKHLYLGWLIIATRIFDDSIRGGTAALLTVSETSTCGCDMLSQAVGTERQHRGRVEHVLAKFVAQGVCWRHVWSIRCVNGLIEVRNRSTLLFQHDHRCPAHRYAFVKYVSNLMLPPSRLTLCIYG